MASENSCLIKEGDHVIFKKENNLRLFQVREKRDVWLEKTKFTLDGIVGHPYGTKFEVKAGGMVKLERGSSKQDGDQAGKDAGPHKDNRNLFDLDSNQKLSRDEIEQLKKDGVTGDRLIEHLIENSTTFQEKTEYAQQKWVKKKKKKHLLEFTILKPSSRLLCEMFWSKGPSKICNLRIDTLAQILTLGNVRANTNVAVVDSCLGLVTGAAMERLGGFGKVVSFYNGSAPMRASLDAYGFPKDVMDNLYNFPLNLVNSLKHPSSVQAKEENIKESESITTPHTAATMETDSASPTQALDTSVNSEQTSSKSEDNQGNSGIATLSEDQSQVPTDSAAVSNNLNGHDMESTKKEDNISDDSKVAHNKDTVEHSRPQQGKAAKWAKKGKNKKKKLTLEERTAIKEAREKEIDGARQILLQKNIDCLIVACKFHPTPIVLALLEYVAPSRQIIVFSQFKEAIEDCYIYLRDHGGVINFKFTESWLRDYQVLPNRTHPVIQMSGTGGYLMTATTVVT